MKKTIILISTLIIIAIIGYFGYRYYSKNIKSNIKVDTKLYIPSKATYNDLLDSVKKIVEDPSSFEKLAVSNNLKNKFYPGRYTVHKGMTNKQLLEILILGKQDEIDIRIGNYSSLIELSNKVSPLLESNEQEFLADILNSKFVNGLDTAAALYLFIPNTYKFYWTTSGEEFANKMKVAFDKFWTEDNRKKAAALNMTIPQITTLASIVQLESGMKDEQPAVAALYLNRLRINMKLDADPTIVYLKKKALGFKGKVNRVYYKDLNIQSPYNTYRNKGLPPTPICMPNPATIESTLNPSTHQYIYFVADPKRPGYHKFAKDLIEQEKNAELYREWANTNKVK